jgi:hypothetical protein
VPRRRSAVGGRISVTGPGLENVSYAERGPAVSRAITAAQKALVADKTNDGTWYVRDIGGETLAYVENVEGNSRVVTVKK